MRSRRAKAVGCKFSISSLPYFISPFVKRPQLCSGARTLFSLATLVCRSLDRILDCHRVWADTLETLRRAQAAWADVPAGQDPLLRFYLIQLERLNELALNRC
jgi:hypothetical protein